MKAYNLQDMHDYAQQQEVVLLCRLNPLEEELDVDTFEYIEPSSVLQEGPQVHITDVLGREWSFDEDDEVDTFIAARVVEEELGDA